MGEKAEYWREELNPRTHIEWQTMAEGPPRLLVIANILVDILEEVEGLRKDMKPLTRRQVRARIEKTMENNDGGSIS